MKRTDSAPTLVGSSVLNCRGLILALGGGVKLVGILNVTPDSFFDGGRWAAPGPAKEQAERMVAEGAAAIDLGGQSTRPGYEEISESEEIARVVPVLELIASTLAVPISIDTYKPAVARAALAAGAHWVNDVRGFQGDPRLIEVVAEYGCPAIVMHQDRDFPNAPGDSMAKLCRFFERSLAIAAAAGVPADRLVLDPGIGFAKTPAQQLEILRRLPELKALGCPILIGASHKSVIGHVVGGAPTDRLAGTLAITVLAAQQGLDFVRVHDVAANAQAAKMAEAVLHAP